MQRVPDFERVRRTIRRREPDRVPLAELEISARVVEAWLGRSPAGAADEVRFWAAHGYDFYCPRTRYPIEDVIEFQTAADGDETDPGAGRQWAPEHSGVIRSRADLDALPWRESEAADLQAIPDAEKCLPDGMGIVVHVGGFFEFIWQLLGFETFAYALADDPELIEQLTARVGGILFRHFENTLAFETVAGVWLCDDIAYTEGLLVAPEYCRRHVFPWHRKIGRICRDKNLPLIYHSDGDLRPVLDDIVANGVDVLHPIEPKAMDIVALKQEYGNVLSFAGNVDLGYTLTRGTPAEVRAEVRRKIATLAPGGGYLCGSSNSIPEYVPLANFEAMCDAVAEYGRYPIRSGY